MVVRIDLASVASFLQCTKRLFSCRHGQSASKPIEPSHTMAPHAWQSAGMMRLDRPKCLNCNDARLLFWLSGRTLA
jgi:hypothetical protein